MWISRYIIYFIVGTIPILFAAVQPWIWSFYTVVMVLAFLISLWRNQSSTVWKPAKICIFSVGLFFGVTLLQSLPLSDTVVSMLSPFRYETLTQAAAILGSPVSWLTVSYAPLTSLAWWTFLLGLFLFFRVFGQSIVDSKDLTLLIRIVLGLAFLEAVYGIVQSLIPSLGVLWVGYVKAYLGDARGTYINRNHFAGLMEMTLPLGLGYTLAMGTWHKKVSIKSLISSDRPNFQFFLSIGLTVMVLALLLSRSRAGIFGGVLGFLTFVLLMRSSSGELPRSFWVITSVIIGMVAFYSLKIGIDPVLERFLRISKEATRLDIWRDSLAMIKDHPLGIGLAASREVFPVYNTTNFSDVRFLYLHNDYLQLLAEVGWLGFGALVVGFYIFLAKSLFKIRKMHLQADPLRFFLAVGALSGLVSIAFHSFFDFNLQMPANCVYFVMLMGIVYNCAWRSDKNMGNRIEEIGKRK